MQTLLPLAASVAARLVARGETLAVAESSSGGLVAAALLAQPGASRFFLGGAVVYTAAARALIGLSPDALAGARSASPPYAALLAETVRARMGAVWGLAETGAAGPTGNRYGDAAGHSCLALAGPIPRGLVLATGSDDRVANMRAFAAAALRLLADGLDA